MSILMIVAGLAILTVGADFLIRGATTLARRFGFSELLIGLTLVGFGTSTPELLSSIEAVLKNAPDIAVGNVVGSNIANILLILGLSAFIKPIPVDPRVFRRDSLALAAATVAVIAVCFVGEITRLTGAALFAGLLVYIIVAYRSERSIPDAEAQRSRTAVRGTLAPALLSAAAGLTLLGAGAKLLVSGAIEIASAWGASETLIGLTIVAVGTSLPELFTSVIAARRGNGALALGNVIGSNLYNSLGILGATAMTAPLAVAAQIVRVDNWVMLAATTAMIIFARTQRCINRVEGGLLLAGYAGYIGLIVSLS